MIGGGEWLTGPVGIRTQCKSPNSRAYWFVAMNGPALLAFPAFCRESGDNACSSSQKNGLSSDCSWFNMRIGQLPVWSSHLRSPRVGLHKDSPDVEHLVGIISAGMKLQQFKRRIPMRYRPSPESFDQVRINHLCRKPAVTPTPCPWRCQMCDESRITRHDQAGTQMLLQVQFRPLAES